MTKAYWPKKEGKKLGSYKDPLKVNGPFMDIMKAAVKHREANTLQKRQPNKFTSFRLS